MIKGCYYRCPIIIEDGDAEHPRFFVLAQLVEYNQLADAIRVKMHDLLHSRTYYEEVFRNDVYTLQEVTRCEALPGGTVEGTWGRGTIIARTADEVEQDGPYYYWVKLPSGQCIKACETEIKIEYTQMNFSPVLQLRTYEFQHPSWFLNHMKVSRNLHITSNATYGFRVLAGCRAFLLPHQISTVARCFETKPVRYMLADEVGLGKTVEACSILSILAHEKQKLKTLIVVPSALIGQWKNELYYKYGLVARESSGCSHLCLLPMEDLNTAQAILGQPWDLAIIDETHRLLNNLSWYTNIQKLSKRVEHILLLSATPIQDRNEEYRRLLALLSPEQYSSMSADQFAGVVRKQKKIQQVINQQIGRLDRYEEYKEIILEKLEYVADTLEDKALINIIQSIDLNSEDMGLNCVKQAIAYVCENYRVERRVIRNRRQLITEKMAHRCVAEVPYVPLTLNENYNESGVIESTLAYLDGTGEDDASFISGTAIPLLGALFSSPWAYEEVLKELKIKDEVLMSSAAEWKRQAENELALVNVALDEDPDMIKGRLLQALNYMDQETDVTDHEDCKIVVFTGYSSTLKKFLSLFNARYNAFGIRAVPFERHMSRSELEDSVYDFQNDPSCRVIVCDETGGEGRNFQNAQLIIHLDLPWNANALEQRIGRLDRLGRDPNKEVLSVVLYTENTIEEQLFHIWKDGMKLFSQSLSGLEIITGELNELIVDALSEDYHNGLADAFDDILDQADEMRESVEDEQDFDLGVTLYRPLAQGVDNVLSMYATQEDNLFADAMMGWGRQAGLYAELPTSDGLIEFRQSSFSVNAAKQSLLIPPDWSKYNDSKILQREGKILGTFDRGTAAKREDVLFFAPGDAVYDSIISNAVGCSRGRCTAIETSGNYNYVGVVFFYNVTPKIDELLEKKIGMETLSQYRMYLPLEQIVVPMGLTRDSREIPEDTVIETLTTMRFRDATHLGRRSVDSRLATSPLDKFILQNPPSSWEPLVDKCSALAYKKALSVMKAKSDLQAAKNEMLRVLNGYRSECIYFERDLEIVQKRREVYNATLRALASAKPTLDAVCFLKVRKYGL